MSASTWNAAEAAARHAYGRLLAHLAARWRDVAAAEDALSAALLAALQSWPRTGVPARPEAWLMTAARRKLLEAARHQRVVEAKAVLLMLEEAGDAPGEPAIPDVRLSLMFVCAHPAIDEAVRTPLMLQTVLGIDAARIASAFLVSPAAMARRLSRAKQKIKAAAIPFEPPEPRQVPERLHAVLEGIYAAFGTAWDGVGLDARPGLAEEALFLARLVVQLAPDEPEAQGLLALMSFSHARAGGRTSGPDGFVPLAEQDVALWDRVLIEQAEVLLAAAATRQRLGPFQLEAAIQSAHCQRLISGHTPWCAIAELYHALNAMAPTVASQVAEVVALMEAGQAASAQQALARLSAEELASYQPYWVVRAFVAARRGAASEAKAALERAIGLTSAPAVRAYLAGQLDRLRASES